MEDFGVGALVEAGLGLILGDHNDKRQIKQQEKLQKQQIQGQMQMTDYNQQKALEMWQNTNYDAQRQQMEKAGLNVGLMYGQGGGGGTTANVTSGNVSAPTAEGQKGEIGMAMQLGLQQALTKAQIELTEAQKRKTENEADNIGEGGANRNQTLATTEGIKFDNILKDINSNIATQTEGEQIQRIRTELQKANAETQSTMAQAKIDNATIETEIQRQKDAAAEQALKVLLTKANINLTDQKIKESIETIKRMEAMTDQGQKQIELQKLMTDFNTSDANKIRQWTQMIGDVTGGVMNLSKLGKTKY